MRQKIREVDLEIFELKRLKEPPKKLYFKGDLSLINSRKISIVGSRKMSVYTKDQVSALSAKLSNAGIVVVSGGALGVDIAAAKAAMPRTIGVFANSLDTLYPKNNALVISDIYDKGLALSEYEATHTPSKYEFLYRNRLVVALGEVLVIAQADFKSGSLQSARLAKEQGKKVFVLPQRLGESDGTNALVAKADATLIWDLDAFVRDFVACKYSSPLELDLAQSSPFIEECKKTFSHPNCASSAKSDLELELDEVLKTPQSLDFMLEKYCDALYEYELAGLLRIDGVLVKRS